MEVGPFLAGGQEGIHCIGSRVAFLQNALVRFPRPSTFDGFGPGAVKSADVAECARELLDFRARLIAGSRAQLDVLAEKVPGRAIGKSEAW